MFQKILDGTGSVRNVSGPLSAVPLFLDCGADAYVCAADGKRHTEPLGFAGVTSSVQPRCVACALHIVTLDGRLVCRTPPMSSLSEM